MSNVWQTRHRLMLQQLEKLADQLRNKEPIAPAVLEEQTVRLVVGAIMLLSQHTVNKRGQCQYCRRAKRIWRLWRRRPKCTVYRVFSFALTQRPETLWRRLLNDHKTRPKFG